MKANIIRDTWGFVLGFIVLSTKHTSKSRKRTGVFLCLIFPLLGWICVLKESSYPVILPTHFSDLQCPCSNLPLILLHHLSALLISTRNVHLPFSRLLLTLIPITRSGFKVIKKKRVALNPSTPITKSPLASILHSKKRRPLRHSHDVCPHDQVG